MSKSKILYLLDGSSLVYRSFYALKLSTSKGIPAGAVYGFITTLRKIMRAYNPEYMGVCFDVSRKTFRREKYKDYKLQRPPTPDGLKIQMPAVKKAASLWGIRIIEKEGYEADDLIAAVASYAVDNKWQVVVVTNDKDMYQLITDERIVVYNPVVDRMFDEKTFIAEFGFPPYSIVDYLALTGDSVDNIPGARGIGKVGASRLIREFGNVDNIFKNIDRVGVKLKKLIEANRDSIVLSRQLVKLEGVASPVKNLEDLKIQSPRYTELFAFYREWEFNSLIKDIPVKEEEPEKVSLDIVGDDLVGMVRARGRFIFYPSSEGVFVFDEKKNCIYKCRKEDIIASGVITDGTIEKVSYDFKKHLHGDERFSLPAGRCFDVMLAAYLINPALGDYSLDNLCRTFLNKPVKSIDAAAAVRYISELYISLRNEIKTAGLEELFFEVEMPLVEVLAAMEAAGVSVDREELRNLVDDVNEQMEKITEAIYSLAGEEFNLNSPKQLSKVLFENLKIPPLKKTKTGFSTNEEVLQKLSHDFPVAARLLEYRHLNKLRSSYLRPFMDEINKTGGRIHAEFSQTGTQTGRLSCRSPNLQNIPIKSDYAQKIRKIFIPTEKRGYILSSDYSQIELRILAHFSGEENLITAFKNNVDIHSFTASLIFGIPSDSVDKHQREVAKRINFGIIYGMSSYGLARELNISQEEAAHFIEDYFSRYPGVKKFIEDTTDFARTHGFVRTLMGRIRYLPQINSPNHELREFARRQAINTPIQGSAADLIKLAMVRIFREVRERNLSSRMVMQVHDELVFDVAPDELDVMVEIVRRHMEKCTVLNVPLVANLKVGKNWLEMEPYGR